MKRQFQIRDRDYLLDTCGNYLKVIGDYHPKNKIVSYVKYFPSTHGTRTINQVSYGYNTFVPKSFVLLSGEKDRYCFSDYHSGVVTCTPANKVRTVFSCREKIQTIFLERHIYESHKVGSDLIAFITEAQKHVDMHQLGITGSFLIDCYNQYLRQIWSEKVGLFG